MECTDMQPEEAIDEMDILEFSPNIGNYWRHKVEDDEDPPLESYIGRNNTVITDAAFRIPALLVHKPEEPECGNEIKILGMARHPSQDTHYTG